MHRLAGQALQTSTTQAGRDSTLEEYKSKLYAIVGSEATNYALLELVDCLNGRSVMRKVKRLSLNTEILKGIESPSRVQQKVHRLRLDIPASVIDSAWQALVKL